MEWSKAAKKLGLFKPKISVFLLTKAQKCAIVMGRTFTEKQKRSVVETPVLHKLLERLPPSFAAVLVFAESGIDGITALLNAHYANKIIINGDDEQELFHISERGKWPEDHERAFRVILHMPACKMPLLKIARKLQSIRPHEEIHPDLKLHTQPLSSSRSGATLQRGAALKLMEDILSFGSGSLKEELQRDWGINTHYDILYEQEGLPGKMVFDFRAPGMPSWSITLDPFTGDMLCSLGREAVPYTGIADACKYIREQMDIYLMEVIAA